MVALVVCAPPGANMPQTWCFIYVCACACVYVCADERGAKNRRKKFFSKKLQKNLVGKNKCLTLQQQNKPNNLKLTIMTKKATRANSAKETAKRVNNRRAAAEQVETTAAAVIEDVAAVETIETQEATAAAVVCVPITTETETESDKVSSKEVLKAAGSLRAAVKEERRGANVTIRLIAERAAAGDTAAVNILCALCDVPRSALFSLNVDKVRAAVNAYFPYYIETEGRKVSVKPAGVWYSTELPQVGKVKVSEPIEDAAKRVQRGYMAVPVADYLDQLIKAAKSRAKGVKPRRVDAGAIYNDIALSEAADGITATEIDEAKARRAYSPNGVNVWRKHSLIGFYI